MYLKSSLPAQLAGLLVSCALLGGCRYPNAELNRNDHTDEDGFTVHFNFLIAGLPSAEAGASAAFAGSPSLSVLPGSFTPAVYKISARTEGAGAGTGQTAYIAPALGANATGTVSLPAVAALTVDVEAYSAWTDTANPPDTANLLLQKNGITFTAAEVASGTLRIILNPLTDGAPGIKGGVNLKLAWPAGLDVDSDTSGTQGITKVTANLINLNGTPIDGYTSPSLELTSFTSDTGGNLTAPVAYTDVPAGSYKLRLAFYRGTGSTIVIGYFTEVVTVWPDSTADKWIDQAGEEHVERFFTQAEFYDAAASVAEITVKRGSTVLPAELISGTEYVVKAAVKTGSQFEFKIMYDTAGDTPSGKSLKSVKYFTGTPDGAECTGNFGYSYEVGNYVSTGTVTVSSGSITEYRVEVCIQAPDRVTTKTYIYRFAAAMLNGTTPAYHFTAKQAVAAAPGGTVDSPNIVTVLDDTSVVSVNNITIGSGKYIKIVSDSTQRTLKRAPGNTASLITVNGQLTLENIVIDGGAVWSGGIPPTGEPPSPAYGAANSGTGALYASDTLVFVSGAGAKLTLGADAVVQNNCNTQNGSGGGIRATGGAQVVINGAGAAVRYNRASWVGGGIALHDNAPAKGTKLTLINGSVDNNSVTVHDGGGIATEFGIVDVHGGTVTKNYAPTNGGGILYSNGGAGLTASISGGSISNNRAKKGGGILIGTPWTITMSGSAVISGNTAAGTGNNGGGVYMETGSLTLSGSAEISGNTALDGGGVTVSKRSGETTPVFTLEGGALIDNNTATSFAGGVNILDGGTVIMNGGTISNNTGIGGGAALRGTSSTFTMNDGTISGNESRNEGGGVYIGGGSNFTMYGGSIRANRADTSGSSQVGGGVFVSNFSSGRGYFIKRGGTIYGNNASADSNVAPGGGPAVYAGNSGNLSESANKYRNVTAGDSVRMYYYNGGMNDPGSTTPSFSPMDTAGEWQQ